MFYKFLISAILVLFVAACATKPKDSADASGSGATSSDSSVSTEDGTITETAGSGVILGSFIFFFTRPLLFTVLSLNTL